MEYSVFEIALYFLNLGSMTPKKLQKLCYYAQVWHLALLNRRIINCNFEAWVHGPISSELYQQYKGYGWQSIPQNNNTTNLDKETCDFLDRIWATYGNFDGHELESLSHNELPWREARKGITELEPSTNIISELTMKNYYKNIFEQSQGE